MVPDEIKQEVREHYRRAATDGCCGPACGCDTGQSLPGPQGGDLYAGTDGDIVKAADLGLGCGTPVAFADLTEGMTVLDLGSGAGIDVFIAARAVGPNGTAIGVDMTDEMVIRAEANRRKLRIDNARFLKGEIETLPVATGTIDRVISNCVINLVPDKAKAFAEIFRVLKPGGGFTVSDIVSMGAVPDHVRRDPALWAGCIAGALDREEYLKIVRDAGFVGLNVVTERVYPVPARTPFTLRSITLQARKPE